MLFIPTLPVKAEFTAFIRMLSNAEDFMVPRLLLRLLLRLLVRLLLRAVD